MKKIIIILCAIISCMPSAFAMKIMKNKNSHEKIIDGVYGVPCIKVKEDGRLIACYTGEAVDTEVSIDLRTGKFELVCWSEKRCFCGLLCLRTDKKFEKNLIQYFKKDILPKFDGIEKLRELVENSPDTVEEIIFSIPIEKSIYES